MSVSTTGTVPETRPLDAASGPDRAGASTDDPRPTGAGPSPESPSGEDLVREARRTAQGEGLAPAGELGVTAGRLAYQEDLVYGHLGTFYKDPDRAFDRLHAIDGSARTALAGGDPSVLGELRDDAPPGGPQTAALAAHREVHDLFPDEAALVRESREQARTEAIHSDPDPVDRGPDRTSSLGGPNDPAGDLERSGQAGLSPLGDSMEHRVIAHAMSPHQI